MNSKYDAHSWKGIFLNDLAEKFKFKKYLELGIATGETWNLVNTLVKVGVDLDHRCNFDNVINLSTDEYFESISKTTKFDLVFIDACHEKNHVKNDFLNSFNHLHTNGIIVFHDINSWTEDSAKPNGSNGDCYEFWISLVNNYPENCFTYCGMGSEKDYVGLFFKNDLKKIDASKFENMEFGYEYLCNNREKYLYSIDYLM